MCRSFYVSLEKKSRGSRGFFVGKNEIQNSVLLLNRFVARFRTGIGSVRGA